MIPEVTLRVLLHCRVYRRNVRSPHVIRLLRHLLRHIPGWVMGFWDGGPGHTSRVVQHCHGVHPAHLNTHFFPAYAPDVNPKEQA